jgi:amino acid permease
LGAGTIGFPYAVMMNGYVLGPILIIAGALLSYYTGMLIVRSSVYTDRTRYEDIALALFGKKSSRITSYLNLICLIGFTFNYVVYIKGAVPQLIEHFLGFEDTPTFMNHC